MSSRGLSNSGAGGAAGNSFRALRDYGSTSSNSNNNINNGITAGISTTVGTNNNYNGGNNSAIPDVDFAGFSPTELVSLSESIAQNIHSVKSSWYMLEKSMKKIGTTSDSTESRDKIQQMQESTNLKILSTSKDLQRLTHIVRRGDKSQKLHVDKLTSEFQIIIQKYSTGQKQIATMLKANVAINASKNRQGIDDDEEQQQFDDDSRESELRQQVILRNKLEFEQGMLIEREQRFQEIEAVVLNVNDIMRDLNSLIYQQSESIDTIENQIDHAATDVENGTAQLLKARESQTRYRKKVLILLVIAVIIGLIVTGIIVSQLKS